MRSNYPLSKIAVLIFLSSAFYLSYKKIDFSSKNINVVSDISSKASSLENKFIIPEVDKGKGVLVNCIENKVLKDCNYLITENPNYIFKLEKDIYENVNFFPLKVKELGFQCENDSCVVLNDGEVLTKYGKSIFKEKCLKNGPKEDCHYVEDLENGKLYRLVLSFTSLLTELKEIKK